jgi:ornithine cyclodeaminase
MTDARSLLLLGAEDVDQILRNREQDLVAVVRECYRTHSDGRTSLPHSVFLHPPNQNDRRIIALPAWLDGDAPVAGLKWIASFPTNHERGLNRASAVIILNSPDTGVAEAVIDGSRISAMRTAASAALAAQVLMTNPAASVGLVGCGPINYEILRFLRALTPDLEEVSVFDLDDRHLARFIRKCGNEWPSLSVRRADLDEMCGRLPLISFATTASVPHVPDSVTFQPGATILHVSLRDLPIATVLRVDNVVDDVDHVCRAATSMHLTEEAVGHRRFIRTTLGDILRDRAAARARADGVTVFSPFGLGVLDLAVARLVLDEALARGLGHSVASFAPRPWTTGTDIDADRETTAASTA